MPVIRIEMEANGVTQDDAIERRKVLDNFILEHPEFRLKRWMFLDERIENDPAVETNELIKRFIDKLDKQD